MTGSPLRTTVISGIVACGVVLAGGGGLGAAIAVADPESGGAPGHSADAGPEVRDGVRPHQDGNSPDTRPATDPTGHDEAPQGEAGPRRGSHPRPSDAADGDPGADLHRDESADPADAPNPEHADAESSTHDGQAPGPEDSPDPSAPAGFAHHGHGHGDGDNGGDDEDDDCGWPHHETFWTWLFHLFTPDPGTVASPGTGGGQGGGPALPSVRIPESPTWPSPPTRLPPEGEELPERAGGPAGTEPPAATPAPPPAAAIPPPVEVPGAAPPPSSSTPPIAVPATPNSTETQQPPKRPAMPVTSPTVPGGVPDGFRVGYPTYLQSASIGEVAGLAALGVSGLAALTALGGLIGFRQAKAGLAVRAAGTARFLQ